MEITVKVTGLDNLANAIFALAKATGALKEETQVQMDAARVVPAVQQTVAPTATVAPTGTTVQSTQPVQNVQSVPTTQTTPTAPVAQNTTSTVNPVPTATATPTYTMEQLAVAATGLIDAGKMQDVQNTLASLGAQTLMDLPQEKYGEFASAIKAIGGGDLRWRRKENMLCYQQAERCSGFTVLLPQSCVMSFQIQRALIQKKELWHMRSVS